MSYSSPIEIANRMTSQLEEDIMNVIFSYGIEVDKDELIKALAYDHEQYEKGYADGQRAGERIAKVEQVDLKNVNNVTFKCLECGQYFHQTAWGSPVLYCSRCGAKLDWDEDIPIEYFENGGI